MRVGRGQPSAYLAAAASFVRWPGGSPVNQYIWDGNWTAHPYFAKWQGQYGSDYIQTADELILTCQATGAEPLVQMNAAVALVEGVPSALDLSLRLLRKFAAAGLTVRYVSFGNEDYGPWETPYGDYPVDGALYGSAFAEWVDGMRAEFPDVYYGVVGLWTPNDGDALRATSKAPEEACAPGRLCAAGERLGVIQNWMGDMLTKTQAVQKADWLVLHDYFYKQATPVSTAALLANAADLHNMAPGVAGFISKFAPATKMPTLALTEFSIAATYSAGGNATARMGGALFLATIIGETLAAAPVAALTEFGWHARWFEKNGRSGSYGSYTFGSPSWAKDTPANTLLPKWYAMALFKKVTGRLVLPATTSPTTSPSTSPTTSPTTSSTTSAGPSHGPPKTAPSPALGVKAYASEFANGEVGLLLLNSAPHPTRVTIDGLPMGGRALAFRGGATLNGWVLEPNATSLTPDQGDTSSPLDAPAVTLNGVGNGGRVGGPWPVSSVAPYSLTVAAGAAPTIDVPAASLVAAIIYGARPSFPSPPPSPPFPPPAPPPPCYSTDYGPCLDSRCCADSTKFGCYKRPTLQYAQCRPLVARCQDTDQWLCPGWWNNLVEDAEEATN